MLKAAIRAQLEKLIRLNRTRTYFSETFEALIASYNAGSRSIEEPFEELVNLSRSLQDGRVSPTAPLPSHLFLDSARFL